MRDQMKSNKARTAGAYPLQASCTLVRVTICCTLCLLKWHSCLHRPASGGREPTRCTSLYVFLCRYYAAAIWPQPQAYDNQGYSWSYESTTIIRNHAATAANIPKSKYNNEAVGRTPFVAGGGIGAVDNSGVFPVGDGVVTTVTYIAADAAGNEAKCTLDVEVTTTFISRFSKIARYIPAKSAADPDSDAESKGDTAAVWVASSTLARFPVGVSGEVCAEKCHKWTNTNETCNYFVQTNGAQGSCILLSLSVSDQPTNSPVGAGFAGHGWEFSFNSDWDTYRRTSTTR